MLKLADIKALEADKIDFVMSEISDTDLVATDSSISNSKICLKIENGEIFINETPFCLMDYVDLGDSYNNGPKADDNGTEFKVLRSKLVYKGQKRVSLRIDFDGTRDIVSAIVSLDNYSNYIKFDFDWNNTQKNHLLQACFWLPAPIETVYSEEVVWFPKTNSDPDYHYQGILSAMKTAASKMPW